MTIIFKKIKKLLLYKISFEDKTFYIKQEIQNNCHNSSLIWKDTESLDLNKAAKILIIYISEQTHVTNICIINNQASMNSKTILLGVLLFLFKSRQNRNS